MSLQAFNMEYALAGLWLAHRRLQNLLSRLEGGELPLPAVFREVDRVEEELGRLLSVGFPEKRERAVSCIPKQAVFPWMGETMVPGR